MAHGSQVFALVVPPWHRPLERRLAAARFVRRIAARTLPADAPADLVTQVLEGRTQGVPEGPNRPVHGLLRLRVAEGVPDRGECLVQLIDRLAERVVHRLPLLL